MNHYKDVSIRAAAIIEATANTAVLDVSDIEELILDIVASEEAGTSTLDIVIQDSPDGTNWYTHTTCAQITANGTVTKRLDKFRRYVRCAITLGGTSFVLGITGQGISRRN